MSTILGTLSVWGSRPIIAAPAWRICSRRSLSGASASTRAGSKDPGLWMPRSETRTKTPGLEISTSDTKIVLPSGSVSVSTALPVGKVRPVLAPPGLMKARSIREKEPGTPSILSCPSGL